MDIKAKKRLDTAREVGDLVIELSAGFVAEMGLLAITEALPYGKGVKLICKVGSVFGALGVEKATELALKEYHEIDDIFIDVFERIVAKAKLKKGEKIEATVTDGKGKKKKIFATVE